MKIKDAKEYKDYWAVAELHGTAFIGFASHGEWGISFTPYLGAYSGRYRDGNENILVFETRKAAEEWISKHSYSSTLVAVKIFCTGGKWNAVKPKSVSDTSDTIRQSSDTFRTLFGHFSDSYRTPCFNV